VFKSGIFFIAVIFLAGCAGNTVHRLPPSEPAGVKGVLPTPPSTQPIPVVNYPLPAVPQTVPITTWTSLSDWAAQNHIGTLQRLNNLSVAAYAIASKNGTMVMEIGSREVTWNGIQLSLGFAPQFIDGAVCLYGLDLQKNLEPLLCDPPLEFPTNGIIVIDPGHGGSNSGAPSILAGNYEKEYTLDLAERLKPLLEAEGWKVFLTRTSDMDVSLTNRVTFAEEHHANFFISLHFNSAGEDSKQAGVETYCLTPTGMPSTITRNFADPWTEVLPDNAFDVQNLQLAVRIQAALVHMGIPDRGVRRARFIGVLRGQRRPAILIEGGYLSNPREAKLIASPDYRQKLAVTLAAALKPDDEN
jgi:N-acetylmuramoyl-L-alanine amidase